MHSGAFQAPIPEEGRTVRRVLSLALTGLITTVVIGGGFYIYQQYHTAGGERPKETIVEKVESVNNNRRAKKFGVEYSIFSNPKISALTTGDYLKMKGKSFEDYEIVGVSGLGGNIPDGVEAIVDCKPLGNNNWIGTALFPRK